MKRIINLKEIMIVLMSVVIIALIANTVFAVDPSSTLGGDDYNSAQQPQVSNSNSNNSNNNSNSNNSLNNNAVNNNLSNNSSNNTARRYNTNSNTNLPQTGIEDYNVGILLVICVASAIYAYKKVKYYKNI